MATTDRPPNNAELEKALDELGEANLDLEEFAQKHAKRVDEITDRVASLLADRGLIRDWRKGGDA